MTLPRRLLLFSPLERLIALRYLRPRGKEGFISVIAGFSFLGIALGVATLIIVMSVMNGFRHELLSRVLGFNGHILVAGLGQPLTKFDDVAKRIRTVKGVVSVTPAIEGQVMITANNRASGALVRGLRPGDIRTHRLIAGKIDKGSLKDFKGRDSIVLGYRMARRLGVRAGSSVTLISPQGSVTPFGTVPRLKTFKVVATFNIGMSEYDRGYVFMPLRAAQIFFRLKGTVSNLEVMIAEPDKVKETKRAISERRIPNIRLLDWQQNHSTFFNALEVERNVMFLILTLIIVVAAFNIISSLIMLVKSKTRSIAILRTMGATRSTVMRIFFMSGGSIGLVGTLAGLGLGVGFSLNIDAVKQWLEGLTGAELFAAEIYFLSRLPAIVEWNQVALVTGMSLVLSFLATLYPSARAGYLDPVEALRNE
ncbi:MAG: lipoprotein-releasing ABC transporter permease subunit [Pseudomonadota bacterium]